MTNLSSGSIKRAALAALHKNWKMAIVVSLVVSLLSGGLTGIISVFNQLHTLRGIQNAQYFTPQPSTPFSGVSSLISLITMFFAPALTVGQIVFYLKLCRGKAAGVNDMFALFRRLERIFKALAASIIVGLIIALWALLTFIPGFIILWIIPPFLPFVIILLIAMSVPAIMAAYRYALVLHFMADDFDIGVMEALSKSKETMYGNRKALFVLHLSFLGWILLGVAVTFAFAALGMFVASMLVIFVGSLFLMPYYMAANAEFYLRVVNRDEAIEIDFDSFEETETNNAEE